MLVDGNAAQIAKALLIALGHHDVIPLTRPANEIRALDGRTGRAATDDSAPSQHALDRALRARSHVGIDQPPLPAAAEPDTTRFQQRCHKFLAVGFLAITRMKHGHVLHAEIAAEDFLIVVSVDMIALGRGRNQHKLGVATTGQRDEAFSRLGHFAAAVDHQ